MHSIILILAFAIVPLGRADDAARAPENTTAAPAITTPDTEPSYRLRLYHTHTDEHIDVVYRKGDTYLPDAIDELDYFLRDSRNGSIAHFDPRLFDLLHELTATVGRPEGEIDVVCGYRTPETNRALRRRSRRVAKHSLHMQAMAIDIRVPGVSTQELRNAALDLHEGGVGYYRRHAFVHVDVGPVRKW
ncbi:MAG TPA: DUF882 domain-containing protein [Candidatus Angelobacter sp.]|nr:DUF882 domain-containing protein [Candidatus Angelobacter sp.]